MPAYLFANVDVTDAAGYEQYRQRVCATIEAYGGRYLVRGGAAEVLEGDWAPKRMVILEFADMAQLKAWYHSPEDMIDIQSFTWVQGSNEYDEWTATRAARSRATADRFAFEHCRRPLH